MHDGVLVLDVFDDAADEPLRALWRGIHGDESEGRGGHRRRAMRGGGRGSTTPLSMLLLENRSAREGAHMMPLGKVV